MAGYVADDMVQDANLWKAVAGAAESHLPALGSPVYYLPHLHGLAAGGAALANQLPLMPGRIPAVVTNIELRARGEDPYIRYQLHLDGGQQAYGVEGLLPGIDADAMVFYKKLVSSDMSDTQGSCRLPNDLAATLQLPTPLRSSPKVKSAKQVVTVCRLLGHLFDLSHKYVFATRYHFIGAGWLDLKRRNKLAEGDLLVFTKRATPGSALKFGMRRIKNGASASPANVDAAISAILRQEQVVWVDYFPVASKGQECVVLRSCLDTPGHNQINYWP